MDAFFSTPLETRLARHLTESPEQAALTLFHSVAAEVPAYRDFLKRGFKRLPTFKPSPFSRNKIT